MKEKRIYIADIGEVNFIRSNKASNLRIKVSADKGVSVTYPILVSLNKAKSFIEQKKKWIIKHLEKQKELSGNKTIFKPDTIFKTRFHELVMHQIDGIISVKIFDGKINLYYPIQTDFQDEDLQVFIGGMIEEAWRIEAKEYLPNRTEYLAEKYNFKYTYLGIRNSKTRWGSCSGSDRINLSLHLMRLPDHLIDYVILHELTHTIHKNHSSEFWAYLDNLIQGKSKEYRKELRNFVIGVY